jgi:hypothetical protein
VSDIARYQQELKKQLGFLRHSCQSYDEGYVDEVIRIASVIRTLIHDTQSSTSLLKHLNATGIKLWSTTGGAPENAVHYQGMGQYRLQGGVSASFGPSFDDTPMELLPVRDWWDQVVYVFSIRPEATTEADDIRVLRLSRRDIVLTATNKDGGAHVDARLPLAYETLAADGALGSFYQEIDGVRQEIPIKYAHLVSLRQMGFEVLRSLSGNGAPVEDVRQEVKHVRRAVEPVEHVLQEFKPLGGDSPQATLSMRCGTLGPGSEGWRKLNVEVTPIDTGIGIYSFTCPYCQAKIVWDPRELRPPATR